MTALVGRHLPVFGGPFEFFPPFPQNRPLATRFSETCFTAFSSKCTCFCSLCVTQFSNLSSPPRTGPFFLCPRFSAVLLSSGPWYTVGNELSLHNGFWVFFGSFLSYNRKGCRSAIFHLFWPPLLPRTQPLRGLEIKSLIFFFSC